MTFSFYRMGIQPHISLYLLFYYLISYLSIFLPFVDREEDREITQEDCERRNGTWVEAPDRPREFYCDFGDRDTEEESRFRYTNITLHIFHGENLENSTANYTIKIQLNHSAAPIHADNFRKHVLYGNYNNSTFNAYSRNYPSRTRLPPLHRLTPPRLRRVPPPRSRPPRRAPSPR